MTGEELATAAQVFAPGLLAKARAIRGPGLTAFQAARLRESMAVDIRKLADIAVPALRPPLVSTRAHEWARAREVNLFNESWQSQPRFDPAREAVHYEHWSTVGDIRRALEHFEEAGEVLWYLNRALKIAWITKEENATLTQLGYRTKRPDPAAAYSAAGIELVENLEDVGGAPFSWEPARDTRTNELVGWLEQVLQHEINAGWGLHEVGCRGSDDAEQCHCRLGRRLSEDGTTKNRLLSRASMSYDAARLWETAVYLAFPYRDRPGYRSEWQP